MIKENTRNLLINNDNGFFIANIEVKNWKPPKITNNIYRNPYTSVCAIK